MYYASMDRPTIQAIDWLIDTDDWKRILNKLLSLIMIHWILLNESLNHNIVQSSFLHCGLVLRNLTGEFHDSANFSECVQKLQSRDSTLELVFGAFQERASIKQEPIIISDVDIRYNDDRQALSKGRKSHIIQQPIEVFSSTNPSLGRQCKNYGSGLSTCQGASKSRLHDVAWDLSREGVQSQRVSREEPLLSSLHTTRAREMNSNEHVRTNWSLCLLDVGQQRTQFESVW